MMRDINITGIATPRLADYFGLWAFEPVRLNLILDRVARMDLQLHVAKAEKKTLQSTMIKTAAIGAAGNGAGGAAGKSVAIVQVSGPLMKQLSSMDDGSSTVALRQDIRRAAADPGVGAILLLIDSPGGTVSGTVDLAADVAAAAEQKPVWALVEDFCASAAYWIACACDKIYVTNATADVGSIGVFMAMYDYSGAAGQKGIKAKVYGSGSLKGAGFPGMEITAAQDAYFQAGVEETNAHFIAAVAKGRKMTPDQVRALATGAVYSAAASQKAGLIDGIKSFDDTLAALESAMSKSSKSSSGKMPAGRMSADAAPSPTGEGPIVTEDANMADPTKPTPGEPGAKAASLQELKAALPKSTAEFREKCIEKGATLQQAMSDYIADQDAALEDATAKAKSVGGKPVGTRPRESGAPAADAGEPIAAFKAIVDSHLKAGIAREKAWSKAVRENPDAHAAYIEAYNALHKPKPRR